MIEHNPRLVAARLASVLEPMLGSDLPVRLRGWDGSTVGPAGTHRRARSCVTGGPCDG